MPDFRAGSARFDVPQNIVYGSNHQAKENQQSQNLHTGLLTANPENTCLALTLLRFPFPCLPESVYNFFDDEKGTLRDVSGQFSIGCIVRVPNNWCHVVQWRHRGGPSLKDAAQ
jgi:hypothetical protein